MQKIITIGNKRYLAIEILVRWTRGWTGVHEPNSLEPAGLSQNGYGGTVLGQSWGLVAFPSEGDRVALLPVQSLIPKLRRAASVG